MHRSKAFTKMPYKTFKTLQLDAGVILEGSGFSIADTRSFSRDDIICATTGGIQISCVPSYVDLGEDVDNCPTNVLELKDIESWDCSISFTSLGTSPELIALALGAADYDENGQITPRAYLNTGYNIMTEKWGGASDFRDIWWVGDRADGGLVAVKLINALSTGGFSLQTTKAGKGQTAVTLTGHVSLEDDAQTIPMEFYSLEPDPNESTPSYDGDAKTYVDEFICDGTNTVFTLRHFPDEITSVKLITITIKPDGSEERTPTTVPDSDYEVVDSVVTFATAPANGKIVEITYDYH